MTAVTFGLYRTTVGKKAIMAVTGLVLYGFVIVHMLGNLKIFLGREHFNEYALGLRELGAPFFGHEQALWVLRAILLVSVITHIAMAAQLTLQSRRARPRPYKMKKAVGSSYASRTMRWGGVIIGLFVVYHLLHMTTGQLNPGFVHGDAYGNMVRGFQHWYVFAIYALAVLALAAHVHHGFYSLVQTLGAAGRYRHLARLVAMGSAGLLAVGYLSGPAAILFGVIGQ